MIALQLLLSGYTAKSASYSPEFTYEVVTMTFRLREENRQGLKQPVSNVYTWQTLASQHTLGYSWHSWYVWQVKKIEEQFKNKEEEVWDEWDKTVQSN